MVLRDTLIRLAHARPELRQHLLPLLREAAGPTYQKYREEKQKAGEKPMPEAQWEAKVLGKKREEDKAKLIKKRDKPLSEAQVKGLNEISKGTEIRREFEFVHTFSGSHEPFKLNDLNSAGKLMTFREKAKKIPKNVLTDKGKETQRNVIKKIDEILDEGKTEWTKPLSEEQSKAIRKLETSAEGGPLYTLQRLVTPQKTSLKDYNSVAKLKDLRFTLERTPIDDIVEKQKKKKYPEGFHSNPQIAEAIEEDFLRNTPSWAKEIKEKALSALDGVLKAGEGEKVSKKASLELRGKLIRLAHAKPELRDALLPLIKEACGYMADDDDGKAGCGYMADDDAKEAKQMHTVKPEKKDPNKLTVKLDQKTRNPYAQGLRDPRYRQQTIQDKREKLRSKFKD